MSFIAKKTLRNFLFQNFLNLMLRNYELLKSLAILCQNIAADSEGPGTIIKYSHSLRDGGMASTCCVLMHLKVFKKASKLMQNSRLRSINGQSLENFESYVYVLSLCPVFLNSSPMAIKIEETYNSPISQIYRNCKWIHQFRR